MRHLLISLFCLALITTTSCYRRIGSVIGAAPAFKVTAKRTDELPLTIAPGAKFNLENKTGSVTVVVASTDTPTCRAMVTGFGEDQAMAETCRDRYSVRIEPTPDGQRVVIEGKPLEIKKDGFMTTVAASIDFTIEVPATTIVDVSTEVGDVRISGSFSQVSARTTAGKAMAEGIRGSVTLNAANGEIRIQDCSAGTIAATFVNGSATLTRSGGNVTITGTNGDVRIADSTASSARIKLDSGSVLVNGGGHAFVEIESGSVDLKDVAGAVDVTLASSGDVSVAGKLDHCKVDAKLGTVRVVATPGSVMSDDWVIETEVGNVSLRTPPDLAFKLDASVDTGTVKVTGTLDDPEHGKTKVRGTRNGGTHEILLHASKGDVRVD